MMVLRSLSILVAGALVIGWGSHAGAHEIFQDVLKDQYMLKSFSCKTCHPDNDDRTIRSAFAERIHKQLRKEGKDYSSLFAEAVKKDEQAEAAAPDSFDKTKGAVSEFEKMMAGKFKTAMKEVGQQTMTIDEIINSGLFYGARLDTKRIEEAQAAEKK